MKTPRRTSSVTIAVSLLLAAATWTEAANVPPSGYTNSFATQPAQADWASANRSGLSNDPYDMDAEASTNVPVAQFTNAVVVSSGNPPGALANASWSSTGLYLQTRPSSSRYVMLLGKFVNQTGTNATEIALSYRLNFAGTAAAEDTNKGTRVYYSLTGATGSWVNIPAFNTTNNSGSYVLSTNMPIDWPYRSNLFLLWMDDNAVAPTDTANQIDNFSLLVTAGAAPGVVGLLDAPAHGSVHFSDADVIGSVNVFNGTPPYVVQFYTNGGAGNPDFALAGTANSAPFNLNLGTLPIGTYNVYATVADENGAGGSTNTVTNTFTVVHADVRLTSPTNGQDAPIGPQFQIAASVAVGAAYSVSNVEFFVNGASVGTDSNAPYAVFIPSQPQGDYFVHVAVLDSLGRTTYSATNMMRFVVDPLANNHFTNRFLLGTPATVFGTNVGATTEQGEPTFQFGGGLPTIIWGATLWWKWIAPFSGTASIDTFGSSFNTVLSVYTGSAVNALTLVGRNDNADASTSASRVTFNAIAGTEYQIQVGGQGGFGGPTAQGDLQLNVTMPPVVAITNPAPGAVFSVGTPFTVEAAAFSGAGTVTNVSLYRGATRLGSADAPPYSFQVTNSPIGSNALYAVALDTAGQVGTSAVVRVLVANVGITITSPEDGTIFANTDPITLSAYTSVPGATVTNVSFFVDGQLVAEALAAPFTVVWTNVTGGSHRLTASGFDDTGALHQALPVFIGVGQLLVHSNAVWRYLDDGSDQSNAWSQVGYSDAGWQSGPAQLGYGDGDEATVVNSGPAGNFFITTYFRHAFTATNVGSLTNLILWLAYDDGAAVYLNGKEIYRTASLPAGASYTTLATATVEETLEIALISATNLVEGENIIAAEVHQQAANSSDISFYLQLVALPIIDRNSYPVVALTQPANNAGFVNPASVALAATASDADGSITNVEFFADGVKIGESTTDPYTAAWMNPPVGLHRVYAIATDDRQARTASDAALVAIYDAGSTPLARITDPANGLVVEGPTNMLVTALAAAVDGVTNVQFLADGVAFGEDAASPYAAVWTAPFGTSQLQAVAFGADGRRGTSEVVTVTITIPPTNTVPPTVARQFPPAFTDVTNANFTNITVIFSERVQGVDAGDLLINGIPATRVTGSGSNYVFGFLRPSYGAIDVAFASGHNITDFGYPSPLPYDEGDGTGLWQVNYRDVVPPVVASHLPATGAFVTNLTTVSVTFSEEVLGVDAADLLVNGSPAFGLTGSGSNYVFNVAQPASGTVTISWATTHGITDLGLTGPPLAFNRTGAGNTWTFTLDSRTTFVASNSTWRFLKGLAEASDPTNAWRQLSFDDSSWSSGRAPFVFGEPGLTNVSNPGTDVSDMASNAYSSLYLRQTFVVAKAGAVTNVVLNHQSDDGFIAWVNGVEVFRYNMPTGQIAFNGSSSVQANEAGGTNGAQFIVANLTSAVPVLVTGTNVLAIHAFNYVTNPASSDFVFNAQLYSFIPDFSLVPPRLAAVAPTPGELFALTNLTVTFTEGVTNVDATDLLVNGLPATDVSSPTNTTFTFGFAQPEYGAVQITWAANHGIYDLDETPMPFDGNAASAWFNYTLVNSNAPLVFARVPSSTLITGLTSIAVTFTKPVTGVDASDLLVNGAAATSVLGSGSNYTFAVTQPPNGPVTVRWTTNNGIQDLELPPNLFERTRPGNEWNYNLVNPVPTIVMTSPTNNAYVLAPANIPLRANATDADGTIALVQYFDVDEDYEIGSATNSPYSVTWSNRSVGDYRARAIATDNTGLRATSAVVTVHVVTEIPPQLVRGPYLQAGSSTGGVVRWRTDFPAASIVRYGTTLGALTNFVFGTNDVREHIVSVGGLQPHTKYYYAVGGSNQVVAGGADYWFITSPVPGTPKPTRLWVLGDSGTANDNARAVRNAYYNLAAASRPADLWLMLGDNAYNSGTDAEHQAAVFDMYPDTLRNYFLWPVIGNHETAQSYTATSFPYLDIFTLPIEGEAGGVPSGNPKYYSFDYANIHFVGLDSMTSTRSATSPMAQWLRNDLANNTQTWVIVFFHHPPYTKGSHNSDAETDLIEMRQNIIPILEGYGVDLVLSGHSHSLERSFLLHGHYGLSTTLTSSMLVDSGDGRTDGTGAYRKNAAGQGVVYTVAGSSGQISGGNLNHPAHYRSLNLLGSLVIDVEGDRLDSRFLTSTGEIQDYFTLLKSQAGPLAIHSITDIGNDVVISFQAYANTTYTLEQSGTLGLWQPVQTFPAAPTNRWIYVTQPGGETNRFYRLRVP